MSTRILKIAIPAAFAFGLLMPNASQASVVSRVLAPEGQSEASFSRTTPTDISAQSSAQRKKNKKSRAARAQAVPAYQPYAYQPYTSGMGAGWGGGWRPADPSFDQNGRPYQPPPGLACPVDLGYGRWGSCDDDF